ncbi:MAG: ATPase [Deltaproteobacteria bacterium]|nr:ATPase [Deltaproteobacteria bacterium]
MKGRHLPRATKAGTAPYGAAGAPCWIGVPGIDELLPDGVRYGNQIMCMGDTGIGKTVLAAQFLYEGLLVGDRCIYVACDESPESMRMNMAGLRIGTLAYERANRLMFLDAYGRERSTEPFSVSSPNDLDEYFASERLAIKHVGTDRPVRLVVDSLSTIFGTADRSAILAFNRIRLRFLTAHGVLTLDNYVTGLLDDQTLAGLSHAYPLILKFSYHESNGDMQRVLQLGKLRSGMFSGQKRNFRIDKRVGIVAQG